MTMKHWDGPSELLGAHLDVMLAHHPLLKPVYTIASPGLPKKIVKMIYNALSVSATAPSAFPIDSEFLNVKYIHVLGVNGKC